MNITQVKFTYWSTVFILSCFMYNLYFGDEQELCMYGDLLRIFPERMRVSYLNVRDGCVVASLTV